MNDFYDEFKMPESDFAKWTEPGQEYSGTISNLTSRQFNPDEDPVPQMTLDLDGGGTITITCGPRSLLSQVLMKRPRRGDHITVKYQGNQGPSKMFQLSVDGARPATVADEPVSPTPLVSSPPADNPLA